MVKKKKNIKSKNKSNLSKIASFTAQSLSSAYSSYKKNQELKKIQEIKLRKLEENNNLIKAARNLYPLIRKIKNKGYKKIAVEKIPNIGIGQTINDRLERASKY